MSNAAVHDTSAVLERLTRVGIEDLNHRLSIYGHNGPRARTDVMAAVSLQMAFKTTIQYKHKTLKFAFVPDARVFEAAADPTVCRRHHVSSCGDCDSDSECEDPDASLEPVAREYPEAGKTLTVDDFINFIDRVMTTCD